MCKCVSSFPELPQTNGALCRGKEPEQNILVIMDPDHVSHLFVSSRGSPIAILALKIAWDAMREVILHNSYRNWTRWWLMRGQSTILTKIWPKTFWLFANIINFCSQPNYPESAPDTVWTCVFPIEIAYRINTNIGNVCAKRRDNGNKILVMTETCTIIAPRDLYDPFGSLTLT